MFQFPAFALHHYVFIVQYSSMLWVFPFGHSRIKDCSHLPATFRNVLRPSSPPSVKASTKCPFCACFVKSQNLNDRSHRVVTKFFSQCYYVTSHNVTSQKVFDYTHSYHYKFNLGYFSIHFVYRTYQLFALGLNRSKVICLSLAQSWWR